MPEIECPLHQAAYENGSTAALIARDRSISYSEYDKLVSSAAKQLNNIGVSESHRVAIISANCIEYPILLMALFRVRAIACPISTRFPSVQIDRCIEKTGCSLAVVDRPAHNRRITSVQSLLLRDVVSLDTVNNNTLPDNQRSVIELDRDATIMSTSGSTAEPKYVLHTYGNHYYSALGANDNIPLGPDDRWRAALPFNHVGGLGILFRCLLARAAVVFSDSSENLADTIINQGITHLSVVPTQLYRLLNAGFNADRLEQPLTLLAGGGSVPLTHAQEAVKRGLRVHMTYGLTEMASQVTTTPPDIDTKHLGTSGSILPYRELHIADDGEIMVRGMTLFRGYVDTDCLIHAVDREGWFHTGDLGRIDDEGFLTVLGRKDNMFISGGENIQPEAIEAALAAIDGIEQTIVVPVRDDEFGFRPVAFLKITDEYRLSKNQLCKQLRQRLPGYMIPVLFLDWPNKLLTGRMKPDRKALIGLAQQQYDNIAM